MLDKPELFIVFFSLQAVIATVFYYYVKTYKEALKEEKENKNYYEWPV